MLDRTSPGLIIGRTFIGIVVAILAVGVSGFVVDKTRPWLRMTISSLFDNSPTLREPEVVNAVDDPMRDRAWQEFVRESIERDIRTKESELLAKKGLLRQISVI